MTLPSGLPPQASGLSKLLDGQSGERQDIILLRLVTCHAIALSPGNRAKLEGLARLLLDRMGVVAGAPQIDAESLDSSVKALHMLFSKMQEFAIQGRPLAPIPPPLPGPDRQGLVLRALHFCARRFGFCTSFHRIFPPSPPPAYC